MGLGTAAAGCAGGDRRGGHTAKLDPEFKRRARRLVPGLIGLILLAWGLDRLLFTSCGLASSGWVRPAGVVFLVLGFLLAGISGRQLTLYGRRDPTLPRGTTDQLVQRGLFCWMRHPAFSGFGLILIGGGLAARSCGFTFVSAPMGIAYLVLFTYLVEEPQLVRRFGELYRNYQRHVPAFVPLPWKNCRRSTL